MKSPKILDEILSDGIHELKLDIGIISNIVGNNYKVVVCKDDNGDIKPGDEFELSHTYCYDVIKQRKTKYYEDVAEISEMLKHPCFLNTQLRAYIGTPIMVDGEVWGTLNFSSLLPRAEKYRKEETDFLESKAKDIAEILADLHLVV